MADTTEYARLGERFTFKELIMVAITGMAAAAFFTYSVMTAQYSGNVPAENTTAADYNRGYVQAIMDIDTAVLKNGIVRVPLNGTHSLALALYNGDATK